MWSTQHDHQSRCGESTDTRSVTGPSRRRCQGIVRTLGLKAIEPAFWHASCNDQGDPPFQGEMRIGYPVAASFEASDAEIADMVRRLRAIGWTSPSGDTHTHGTAIEKNGVTAIFYPQSVGDTTRGIEIIGECRDVTTSKQTVGNPKIVNLST
jgi:hypothetical protein